MEVVGIRDFTKRYPERLIRRQSLLMKIKDIVHGSVISIEDRVTHCCGHFEHDSWRKCSQISRILDETE